MTDENGAFAGRHVVVTGGAGALGTAVVDAFRDAGATCHLPVRNDTSRGPGVRVVPGVELTDESSVAEFYAAVPTLWASIHLAGGFAARPLSETSRAGLQEMLDTNLVTAFLCAREAARRMTDGGRIVQVASRVALEPVGGMAAYVAAKAALAALTRALAAELRPAHILVNAVAPSVIDTAANRAAMPDADHEHWPKPAEVARTILWLASPDNVLTSGVIVPVYGDA